MKLIKIPAILAAAALLTIPAARAQQQQQQQPPPAGSADSGSDTAVTPLPPLPADQPAGAAGSSNTAAAGRGLFVGSAEQDQNGTLLQPDTHVLSSPESFGLGSPLGIHQTFDPTFRVSESVTSGILTNQLQSMTTVGGSLTFDQQWNRYRLTLLYTGAETIYAPESTPNVAYHDATVSQEIDAGRWVVRLRDDVTLSPGAAFSGLYSGVTGLAGSSSPIPPTVPSLSNNETIQTGVARSLTNTSLGEVDFSLTPRASLTATSTYSLIDFLEPGYLNSYRAGASAGYNYSLDAQDSISVMYNYAITGFQNQSNLLITQIVQASYGRKITGRLAFQVSAGPELVQLERYGPSNGQHWSWVLSSGLTYQFTPNTGVQASYTHQVTAGSGVFLGSESDIFTGGLSHQFARTWWGTLNGGYARNSNLAPAGGTSNLYNTYFGGGGVTHRFTRQLDLSLNYGFEQQTASAGTCTVATCGLPGGVHHFGTVTLNWHPLADRYIRSAS